ncbi:MAG: carboxymuconolactone decarboxylase family protein [Sphingomonadaceae bacterium]
MARGVIKPIPLDQIPADYVATAEMMDRLVGDATTIQVLAHSIPATDFYFKDFYQQMFYNGRPGLTVAVREKQLVRLRISKRHGCALCNRNNEEEILDYGFNQDQVDALFDLNPDASLFTDAELALIGLTDQMVLDNQEGRLDEALYARLRRHLSDEQIVEVSLVAAMLVGAGKLTFVLDLVPREATCTMPAPVRQLAAAE